MNQVDCAMMLVGRLAVMFSQLEYFVALILEAMVSAQNDVAGGIVTEEVPLRAKIRYARKLANLHFAIKKPNIRSEMNALLRDIDRERENRNLFVHGMWDFSALSTIPPVVSCRDPRWIYSEVNNSYHWERMRQFRWTLDELRDYLARLNEIGKRSENIWHIVQNELKPKQART